MPKGKIWLLVKLFKNKNGGLCKKKNVFGRGKKTLTNEF